MYLCFDDDEELEIKSLYEIISMQRELTTAVGCVWGSEEAALKRGFVIHQDSHSPGCELYSTQDKMMHFILCSLI